jgi:hypothetical protein
MVFQKQRALLQRKKLSDDDIEKAVSDISLCMRHNQISDSNIMTLSKLLKRCICCADFRKALRSGENNPPDDAAMEAADISLPAGISMEAYMRDPKRTRESATVRGVVKSELTAKNTNELYVYILNLPLRVSEQSIRDALVNVGSPSEIFIYDTRGIPVVSTDGVKRPMGKKRETEEQFRLSSPVNAVVRFNSIAEYERAIKLENKLFGILCKSTDLVIDGNRTMFIEPAERKRNIIISNIPKTIKIDELKHQVESTIARSNTLVDPIVSIEESSLDGERVCIEFPTFESAYKFLKSCRTGSGFLNAGEVVSFTPFRTAWSARNGQFTDSNFSLV